MQADHTHSYTQNRAEAYQGQNAKQGKQGKTNMQAKAARQAKHTLNKQLKLRKLRSVPKQVMHRAAKTSGPQCGWGEEHRCRKCNGDFTEMEHSGIQNS